MAPIHHSSNVASTGSGMKSARSNAQEAEKASGPARGPPRGGSGGPCDHCERTYSPCWRKGPPEKPLLCNACGAHYLVKKSLDGYRPGQKGARTQQLPAAKKPTAAALKRPKKKGASLLGEAAGGEESPSEAGTSGGSPVGSAGKGGRKGITPEPDSSGGKRKRTANRKCGARPLNLLPPEASASNPCKPLTTSPVLVALSALVNNNFRCSAVHPPPACSRRQPGIRMATKTATTERRRGRCRSRSRL